ncbi:hypothetical protein G7078_01950 [Sphingomonas sinipercae]|uniref:Lipoprotein n=1 Tax=Sphingomonas sinipercae TaxID=2714944 RepID=A0A6G7ZL18_9SPHN|nr:hypothetical protein [Sphingomonas sinipercae]QIL01671.1 hypothetical protein G7078_01950 [Sphingomonas sinipercae]
MSVKPFLLLAPCLAGGCTVQPPAGLSARAQSELSAELAGRTAGAPRDCLPRHDTAEMRAIGPQTILFGSGRTIYRNDIEGACNGLGQPGYTLVTRSLGGGQLCRGDIAEVRDLRSGMLRGSCALGAFTPYAKVAR